MTKILNRYIKKITHKNIITGTHFDLTGQKYHGGTTLSSGTLPKWDILNKAFLIKRCSFDDYGNYLTDAANEELIYLFCKSLGVPCAYYRLINIKYFDDEAKKEIYCPAALTEIFPGPLVHYRIVRMRCKLGQINDELIEFSERFTVQPDLNAQFLVDYIFNQQDRHSKNIGLVNQRLSPLFDSGACLFYDEFDDNLNSGLINRIPRHKTFSKPLDELLTFSLRYVNRSVGFEFDAAEATEAFMVSFLQMSAAYSLKRAEFIKYFVRERIKNAGQILASL